MNRLVMCGYEWKISEWLNAIVAQARGPLLSMKTDMKSCGSLGLTHT